jgi:N-acetyl-alpha-D-muramate 1-phosphate uridylyltransferase
MKAMILAAGKGTRLGKITGTLPKALVEINGKSVLQLAVEKCTSSGFGEIIVNVHHLAGQVEEEVTRLNKTGFDISISDERSKLLDTGGGLYRARDFFDTSPFLLYNTDIVTDLDLADLYRFHKSKGGIATLAVRKRRGNRFFLVSDDGMVRGWCNKATGEKIIAGGVNEELSEIGFLGIHLIDPQIFKFMYEGVYSMTSLYLQLMNSHRINTYRHDEGYWYDIGTPENLEIVRNLPGRR